MLYLSPPGPEGGPIRAAMAAGRLGAITTPAQGNRLPDSTLTVSPGNLPQLLRWLEASDAATDGALFDVFAPST